MKKEIAKILITKLIVTLGMSSLFLFIIWNMSVRIFHTTPTFIEMTILFYLMSIQYDTNKLKEM